MSNGIIYEINSYFILRNTALSGKELIKSKEPTCIQHVGSLIIKWMSFEN